jgi:uncharacterized membrane protein YphA (DoxX/SURF4 family)
MQIDPVIPLVCSLILSYVFVVASFHKWQNLDEFRETLTNYQVLPEILLGVFVFAIPAVELICGIALLVPYSLTVSAIGAGILLSMYIGAIAINLLKGRRTIDCGCGGTEQKQAISEGLILRNGVLLFFAYCLLIAVSSRELVALDWVIALLATVVGCLFYNIVNQLLVNKDLLRGLREYG